MNEDMEDGVFDKDMGVRIVEFVKEDKLVYIIMKFFNFDFSKMFCGVYVFFKWMFVVYVLVYICCDFE